MPQLPITNYQFTCTLLQLGVLWNRREDLVGDVGGGDAFRLGGEVGDEAVAEDRHGDGRDIIAAHVELSVENGAGLGGHDQVEAGARAGAPGDPLLDEVEGFGSLGPGDAD